MKMENLEGKVAVITGASSGIGEADARLLVSEGMRVVLVARRSERIATLAQELGDNALPLVADVGDPQQVSAVFNKVRHRFGGLDLVTMTVSKHRASAAPAWTR